jgi:outer membrane protein TolC
MMRSIKIYIAIFVIIIAIFSISNAQGLTLPKDSLVYYLELAAKNNPTVLQRFYEYQAALQKVPQVGALPDPELNLGVFLSPMELLEGKQVADIRLMQMFPWFGTLRAAKDEMSLMAQAKYEKMREAKLEVFYDVQRAWYELYKINQDIQISEKNIHILRTLERLALVRFQTGSTGGGGTSSPAVRSGTPLPLQSTSSGLPGMQNMSGNQGIVSSSGMGSPSSSMQENSMGTSSEGTGLADLYRIQIDIGDLENDIALLRNQQSTVVARFNSYLNRPVQSTVFVVDTLKPETLNVSLLAVSDSMQRNNPMLGMLQYEQQSLDARKKMVTRMGYPMVGLGVNYSLINKSEMSTSTMNGKDMIMPMVAVTLPIYRKKYKAAQTETDLLKSATEQNFKATANSLQTEYYEALQLYQDAQRRIKLYESQVQLAKNSLDIMIKSFSASGSGLTDVLRVRQQTLEYEFKQIEAVADYNTAIAWLKKLMAHSQIQ